MHGWRRWLLVAVVAVSSSAVSSQEAPEAIIQRLSQEVLARAKADLTTGDRDLRRTMALVDTAIMPNVNMQRLTAAAVGPAWRQATPQQRLRLQEEFKTLLVRTYAGALSQVGQETIELRPQRRAPGESDVIVRTELRGRGEPIELAYRMERTPGQGSGWRIYNLNVLGIWVAETYRSQFAPRIEAGGVEGLIAALADRNRANAGQD